MVNSTGGNAAASSSSGTVGTSSGVGMTGLPVAICTQATNLPTKKPDRLIPIQRLTRRDNYEEWAYMAKSQLRTYRLQNLTSTELSKPSENDECYEDWEELSCMVQNWLITQIDSSILKRLMVYGDHGTEYADDCWRAIAGIVLGQGHTQNRAIYRRTVRLTRAEFGSMEQFVNTFRHGVVQCNKLDVPITYYEAALLLFWETKDELPHWTNISEYNLKPNAPREMTEAEFFRICDEAIEKAKEQRGTNNTAKPKDEKKQKDKGNKKPKNSPPNGKDEAEWAKELREKEPAQNQGKCSYCGMTAETLEGMDKSLGGR